MTTYLTNDGDAFDAATPAELVAMMRAVAFRKAADVHAFMAGLARSVGDVVGCHVRADNPEEFIDDLIKAGWLKIVSGKEEAEGGEEEAR